MKKIAQFVVVVAVSVLPFAALAFDPGAGNGDEPRVPQGPNAVVCANAGSSGVAVATGQGGRIHCDIAPG